METDARADGAAGKLGSVGIDAGIVEALGNPRISRRASAASTRAKRCAEPVRGWQTVVPSALPSAGRPEGDRTSADWCCKSVAAKDTRTAASVLWNHSRRDFATRFQWRTARLVFEDVDIARKSLW